MSKDPAFLFYPGDWLGGTMGFTIEQKGAYMELLILQFNNNHFTLTQAKQVLSICFDVAWATIEQKFVTEGKNGEYYFNERLREEIEKRRKFTESRRLNGLSEKKKDKHMLKHMEDENESEIIVNNNGVGNFLLLQDLKKEMLSNFTWLENLQRNNNISEDRLKQLIDKFIKKLQDEDEPGKDYKDSKRHFSNWMKIELEKQPNEIVKKAKNAR